MGPTHHITTLQMKPFANRPLGRFSSSSTGIWALLLHRVCFCFFSPSGWNFSFICVCILAVSFCAFSRHTHFLWAHRVRFDFPWITSKYANWLCAYFAGSRGEQLAQQSSRPAFKRSAATPKIVRSHLMDRSKGRTKSLTRKPWFMIKRSGVRLPAESTHSLVRGAETILRQHSAVSGLLRDIDHNVNIYKKGKCSSHARNRIFGGYILYYKEISGKDSDDGDDDGKYIYLKMIIIHEMCVRCAQISKRSDI